MILINEAYREKIEDEMEMNSYFFSMLLSAQTGKRIKPEKLFKRQSKQKLDEIEVQKALELIKKKRMS